MFDQMPLFDIIVFPVFDDDGNIIGKMTWIWTWEGVIIAFEDTPEQPAGEDDDHASE